MKALFLLAAFALSLSANAVTFKATSCSKTISKFATDDLEVRVACLGTYGKEKAIRLELNDGTKRVYAIDMAPILPKMGAQDADFYGKWTQGEDYIEGSYNYTSGITVTEGLILRTSFSNLTFQGPIYFVDRALSLTATKK